MALTKQEASALSVIVNHPVFRKAIDEVSHQLYSECRGKNSIEESALAFKFIEGGCSALSKLTAMAGIDQPVSPLPKRIKQATLIRQQ